MSSFTQGRSSSRGYGKPGGSQYVPGDRHGHQSRNINVPPNRRENMSSTKIENIPSQRCEDISAGPPLWLDSYLENFKKNFIREITDNFVNILDVSMKKNDSERRRFRSNYFALKKRLSAYEENDINVQEQKIQSPSTPSNVNNDDCNLENNNLQKALCPSCNGCYQNNNKELNDQATPPSSNLVNSTDDLLSSAPTGIVNEQQSIIIETPTIENDDSEVSEQPPYPTTTTAAAEEEEQKETETETSQSNIITDNSDVVGDDKSEMITREYQNVGESSTQQAIISEEVSDDATIRHNNNSIKEILQLLKGRLSIKNSEMKNTSNQKVQSILNELTSNDLDDVDNHVKELKIDTLEKQQGIINIIVEQAIIEPQNGTFLAQICKKIADVHDCTTTFREMLNIRWNLELTRYKEDEIIRLAKLKESSNHHDKDKIEKISLNQVQLDEGKSRKSIAILFISKLYNEELLSDTIIEKILQYLLQRSTETDLKYLCHMLRLIGKKFVSSDNSVAPFMNYLIELRDNDEISRDLTSLINSVVDLMANMWEPLIPDLPSKTTEFEDTAHK